MESLVIGTSALFKVFMAGTPSPGAIEAGGIQGFDFENDWEVKKSKGKDGASITKNGSTPRSGSFTYQLWRDGSDGDGDHFAEDAAFVAALRALDGTGAAIDIQNPIINDGGVSSVVIKKICSLIHKSGSLWTRTIEVLEWIPAPQKATGTPGGSAAGNPYPNPAVGQAQNRPETSDEALDRELEDTLREARGGGGGGGPDGSSGGGTSGGSPGG